MRRLAAPFALPTVLLAASLAAQTPERPAPIGNVRYELAFDRASAARRQLRVTMTFDVAGSGPVVLSLPAWTPGAYDLTYFSRKVRNFAPTGGGAALTWNKTDPDTWRIEPAGQKQLTVAFDFVADSLDTAMAWSSGDVLMVNGTNVLLYPEGQNLAAYPATVTVRTERDWLVATGMRPGSAPGTFAERNYHDLVDMPFLIGRFDYDSARVSDRWVRFATYPAGSLAGQPRQDTWAAIRKMIPPMLSVFGESGWDSYTIIQLADSAQGGGSGLEHQNSHVDIVTPQAVGSPFLYGLFSHEIFHAWNVKRLRPAEMVPYVYDRWQPTPWLWVSEGITDYYSDLMLVRGGAGTREEFLATTQGKILQVSQAPPVALTDASLSTWVPANDGTFFIYYPKGSLAGFALDILIRDASGNRNSLDTVMRRLYEQVYRRGRGFTAQDWWGAVSQAAGGRSFAEFDAKYIRGREPFAWDTWLPLAGLKLERTTVREPRVGIEFQPGAEEATIRRVVPGAVAANAGVQPGDVIVSIGGIPLTAPDFGPRFRAAFGKEGTPVPIVIKRGGQQQTLTTPMVLLAREDVRLVLDPAAGPGAVAIREGLMTGAAK